MSKIVRGTKIFAKGSLVVTVALSACKVVAAKPGERARVAASEAGGLVGGMAMGGLVAYGVCNLVFGLPTGGTSILWCGLVAGAVGGAAGVTLGNKVGEVVYDAAASRPAEPSGADYVLPPMVYF
jgi:hypothetical protein